MKKAIKATTTLLLIIGLISVSCAVTSCSSYSTNRATYNKSSKSGVVKRNYKVKGNQKNNNASYRAY